MEEPDADVVELATRLFGFARDGATAQLAAYIDAGIPVNLTNQNGDSLVMLAAYHGYAETVRALLERGADPNRANDKSQTPLAGAVFKGEAEIAAILVEGGADPKAGHPSALEAALMFERHEFVELFRTA